jgi:hypothetical protein
MATSQVPKEELVEIERRRYLPLLLSNPNYYGNLADSPFKPVKKIVSNTSYEELKCVGFNPQLSRLEGVVWVKRDTGYDGGICTNGSLEYVSFYLSYDNGATWLAQGTTSFQVFDVTGPHPLEYAIDLTIEPIRTLCLRANLPLVRAVLSWSTPPLGPAIPPVWGNAIETRIQIPPIVRKIPLHDFLKEADISLKSPFTQLLSNTATIDLAAPKTLSALELKDLYANTKVPAHRFLQNTIQKAIKNPLNLTASNAFLSDLGIDVSSIIGILENPNGSTEYEQLTCIGLDEANASAANALAGTIQIKLPTGYLGGLCTAGSDEYVAFWIDWGSGWEWAGTASVNVYDIASIPAEGLSYAVYLPVNLNAHRKPCSEGPVTAKVRAILSWDTPPPPSNPNYVPVWGNRLETNILLDPGATTPVGDYTPYLQSICDVAVCNIDQSTGWAPGDSPFGASVSIFGYLPGAPTVDVILAGNAPRYQITVQQIDTSTNTLIGAPQTLGDPFGITITQQLGGGPVTSTGFTQTATAGYFTYQNATPDPVQGWRNISPDGLLAVWNSSGSTGTWLISITAVDPVTDTNYPAGSIICTVDGTTRQGVVIDLDQQAPITDLEITGYMPGGVGPCLPAVNCQTFTVGDTICGTYSVSDEHLGSFSLSEEPFPNPAAFTVDGAAVDGLSYPNPALPLSGTKSGTWTFSTAGLPACGYTIQLLSGDRTIVSCYTNWENNSAFKGFCLKAPAPATGGSD